MRLALIGSGMIVRDLLSVIGDVEGVEVAAVVGRERSLATLDELAATYAIPAVHTDLDVALASDVDTVYVGLPNHLHFAAAKAALLAGKHVICEKPFTLTVAELDELIALAAQRDLILVEAVTTPYLANFRAIVENLPQLGALKVVQCSYSQFSSRYRAFQRGETMPTFDPALGGGALMDIGIYTIHAVVSLLGAPSSVNYRPNVERGVDTSGVLTLDYPGMRAVCVCAKDSSAISRTTVQGVEGTIEMTGPPNVGGPVTVTLREGAAVTIDRARHTHRMYEEFVEFERMIAEHDIPARDAALAHSRAVLMVATTALREAGIGVAG